MEAKLKHLEFIQAVITRMATNSFLFKGWTVTITAGLAAFATVETRRGLLLIGALATLLFWALDGYYLWLERVFRRHFDSVVLLPPEDITFSMNPQRPDPVKTWLKVCFRWHLIAFYVAVVAIDVGGVILIKPPSKG